MSLFSIVFVLFLIMDPLGNAKSFLATTENIPVKKRKKVIAREMLIALFAMLFFNFVGEALSSVLEISNPTVFIATGLILFLIAIKILFSQTEGRFTYSEKNKDPFVVPLAIPLVAGPGLLATIMLYAKAEESITSMCLAIVTAWAITAYLLIHSESLVKYLGDSGLTAFERLVAMILVFISVQRFLEGVVLLRDSICAQ